MHTPSAKQSRTLRFGRYDYAAFTSFFMYAAGSVAAPVALVEIARDLGFTLDEGGLTAGGMLGLGRTLAIVASMLLCGFMAGRWGKRRTLGASVVVMGVGLALCAVAPQYGLLFLAMTLAGLGEGVIEGLATPFINDLHPQEPARYLNFTHGFWSVGVMTTVLAAGALLAAGVSWRLIMAATAAAALIPAALLLLPERSGQKYPEHPEPLHWSVVRNHAMEILRIRRFWLFFAAMFLAGGGEFCLTFWTASYIQLNFAGTAWAGGVGLAAMAAGMVVGRTGWGYLIDQHHLLRLILLSAAAGTLITLTFPLLSNLYVFFGLLFLSGIAAAPFWPSIQSYCADCLPKTDTTMLFILLSCAGIPGCGAFTWLMGYVANQAGGLAAAFYLVPACFAVLGLLMAADAAAHRSARRA